jgi:hypothetical protein
MNRWLIIPGVRMGMGSTERMLMMKISSYCCIYELYYPMVGYDTYAIFRFSLPILSLLIRPG